MSLPKDYGVILFDGVCNLCNHAVDFVIQRDKKDRFKFASLQEPFLEGFLKRYHIPNAYLDSIVFVYRDKVYVKSRAALEIARLMGGFWSLLYVLVLVPSFLRDPVYDWIAKNRYRWYGKRSSCRVPTPQEAAKFLKPADFL
ncbi:YuxK protein [Mariniradius saccharolyticus AK6]|uniref:YuxK protein n=1 Tax=Mariniradius saccharolyticus AK6 TaxID=1239962 RepID=M7Y4M9_9BACT|nr:DCC1-like thiol-disulfide oxidoreductase family protein [Mariniradius saccharolyticus]EMS32211.1 YuxK protein [Mariniradius saccharolyticus AK6]